MACVGSSVVKCSEWWSLRAALKRKNFASFWTAMIRSGPKVSHCLHIPISPYPQHKGQLFSNWSGSVRSTKQTLHPKKGGDFGYMKTLLFLKILANEKKAGVMQNPPCCRSPQMRPPPPLVGAWNYLPCTARLVPC